MNEAARILILVGGFCLVLGVVVLFVGKIPWLGKLPGDVTVKKNGSFFFFPLTTCLLLSVVLSFLMYFWRNK